MSMAVINRTRGSSCLLILRFDSLMYSCPFRRCQFSSFSPYTGGPLTMDHENTVRHILLGLALCLEEVSRWWSHKVLSGCVRLPRKSIHISNFFSASNGRWPYRWDLLDNKFVENNETRRHGGMYSIASFETSILTLLRKKLFMPMVYKIFQMNYN